MRDRKLLPWSILGTSVLVGVVSLLVALNYQSPMELIPLPKPPFVHEARDVYPEAECQWIRESFPQTVEEFTQIIPVTLAQIELVAYQCDSGRPAVYAFDLTFPGRREWIESTPDKIVILPEGGGVRGKASGGGRDDPRIWVHEGFGLGDKVRIQLAFNVNTGGDVDVDGDTGDNQPITQPNDP